MKRTLLLTTIMALFTHALVSAQWGSAVRGEGPVVTRSIDIDNFEGIALGIGGDVYLRQGSSQSVEVEAQENIIENLKTKVKDGVWHIGYEKGVRNVRTMKIYITTPKLSVAGLSGSGKIITETKFRDQDKIKVYISGSGKIKLDVEAEDVYGGISGSGNIYLKGSTSTLDMKISGSGDIHATQLNARSCKMKISGSGNAEVNASEEIDIAITGSGDVKHSGGADKVRARVTGSGDVRKI